MHLTENTHILRLCAAMTPLGHGFGQGDVSGSQLEISGNVFVFLNTQFSSSCLEFKHTS